MTASANVSVSADVIRDVARITTLATEGVLGLVDQPVVISVPMREAFRSVDVVMKEQKAHVSLHVIAADDVALIDLGKRIQHDVSEAIDEMCGVEVHAVDVSIEDVRKP